MFTAQDFGCFGDGAFGHQHVRESLANLLVQMFRHSPRGGDGPYWDNTVSPLVEELRGDMSDDASEEYDAIDLLNERCCSWECVFDFIDGDLMLSQTEEYIEQFGEEDAA